MADITARLNIDSSKYDQKLKSAIEQMTKMEQEVRRTGATFAYADKEELEFVKSLGSLESSSTSARTKLMEYTNAIASLTATYRAMTDEEKKSDFGQGLAASIDQIKAKAAELKDIMSDTNIELKTMASDTSTFDALSQGFTSVVSVVQVGIGAMQAFGVKNKDAMQAMAKLQGVMAVTNGLTKIQAALQKQSAVMVGVTTVQKKAAAAAEALDTAAKGKNIVVTKAATVAQKAFNLVAKANPIGLVITAITAVVGVLTIFKDKTDEASEAQKKFNEQLSQSLDRWRELQKDIKQREDEETGNRDSEIEHFLKIKQLKGATDQEILALRKTYYEQEKKLADESAQYEEDKIKEIQDYLRKEGWGDVSNLVQAKSLQRVIGDSDLYSAEMKGKVQDLIMHMENLKDAQKRSLEITRSTEILITQAEKEEREKRQKAREESEKKRIASEKASAEELEKVRSLILQRSRTDAENEIAELEKKRDKELAIEGLAADELIAIREYYAKEIKSIRDKEAGIEIPLTFSEEGMSDLEKKIKEKMSKLEFGSGDYLIAADNLVDFNTLQTLLGVALKNGLKVDKEWLNTLFKDIEVGADVGKETWQVVIDDINRQLAEKGIDPFKINLDTGSLEEAKTRVVETVDVMKESLDSISKGVGAISTIGNAFNDIKGSVEDLTKAFSGEMDAWDSLMTVFNSGVSIMQNVIGVMEAINTLTELSNTLSDVKVAKQGAETTAVVTGKSTEAAANLQEAGTAMTSAGANAAQSSSAAGKAVAGIPIVGPILAVAAIAAVLAATFAAMSKAKSAGKFAQGGIVPGNNYNDGLVANVSSGELILNRAQQESIAAQLQNNNQQGGVASSSFVTGENIVLGVNNFLGRSGQGEIVTTQMLRRAGINL